MPVGWNLGTFPRTVQASPNGPRVDVGVGLGVGDGVGAGVGEGEGEAVDEAVAKGEAAALGMVAVEAAGCGEGVTGGPEQAVTRPTTAITVAILRRSRAAPRVTCDLIDRLTRGTFGRFIRSGHSTPPSSAPCRGAACSHAARYDSRMPSSDRLRVGMMGTGAMGRHHLTSMLGRADTSVVAVCEPSSAAFDAAVVEFAKHDLPAPPNEPDWETFVERFAPDLDVVFIVTPHSLHAAQTTACLEAGLDVFLEKPMVMDAIEAERLIEARDRTGRLLVVAFPGSLSPAVRTAARMIAAGEVGSILNINALTWQDWDRHTLGTWRQEPEVAGGGFLFDTGAHMLNTVCDLANEDISEVTAWLENDGRAIDIRATVMARLPSGALVTMNACGRAVPSLGSDIQVFCERATLRTGIWGERLEIQRSGRHRLTPVRSISRRPVWEQFLAVRAGIEPNPCPPEVGLRMARLWDAIQTSSASGGAMVRLDDREIKGAA
jgi:predicted dehydrogenase